MIGDLLVGREHVDVGALGEAGVLEQLLERERRLGALRSVLQHDRVAEDEVRHGEAGDLVVGVVPRHDAEDHAGALEAEEGLQAVFDLEHLVGEPLLGVVGEGRGDRARELGLADGLVERLAHLAVDDGAEFVLALVEEFGRALRERRALGDGGGARPLLIGLLRRGEGRLDLLVGGRLVGLHDFLGGRVDHAELGHLMGAPSRILASRPSLRRAGNHDRSVAIPVPSRSAPGRTDERCSLF